MSAALSGMPAGGGTGRNVSAGVHTPGNFHVEDSDSWHTAQNLCLISKLPTSYFVLSWERVQP